LVGFHQLRRVLSKKVADHLWVSAKEQKTLTFKTCPVCYKGMNEVSLTSDLLLDICTRCHMVWFDPEEYERAPLTIPSIDPELRVDQETRKELALLRF